MAFPISLVGISKAGGIIQGPGAVNFRINGAPVSLLGDDVTGHGSGSHASAKMVQGSGMFFINGIAVVRTGNLASCSDQADGFPKFRLGI